MRPKNMLIVPMFRSSDPATERLGDAPTSRSVHAAMIHAE